MLSLPHPLFFGLQTDSNFSFDMPMTSRCQHCCQIFAEATLYFPLQTQGAAAISPVVSTYGGHRFWVPKYRLIPTQDGVRSTSTYIVSTNCVNARTQSGPNSSTKTRLVKFGKLIYSSPSLWSLYNLPRFLGRWFHPVFHWAAYHLRSWKLCCASPAFPSSFCTL